MKKRLRNSEGCRIPPPKFEITLCDLKVVAPCQHPIPLRKTSVCPRFQTGLLGRRPSQRGQGAPLQLPFDPHHPGIVGPRDLLVRRRQGRPVRRPALQQQEILHAVLVARGEAGRAPRHSPHAVDLVIGRTPRRITAIVSDLPRHRKEGAVIRSLQDFQHPEGDPSRTTRARTTVSLSRITWSTGFSSAVHAWTARTPTTETTSAPRAPAVWFPRWYTLCANTLFD